MPTKPTVKTTKVTAEKAPDFLNSIADEIGGAYQQAVPRAAGVGSTLNGVKMTKESSLMNLRAIGEIVTSNSDFSNAFMNTLVNRIAKVFVMSRLYENPWAMKFKKGLIEYGEVVESLFVEMTRPYNYDPQDAETTLYKRYIPKSQSQLMKMNFQKMYPTTTSLQQLKQAFLSWEGLDSLLQSIVQQVYTGANYDEFVVMKYMIARTLLDGKMASIDCPDPTKSQNDAREFAALSIETARKLGYMSTEYNYAGVPTYTDISKMYAIMTEKATAQQKVHVLALAFNKSETEILGSPASVDSFGFNKLELERLPIIFEDDPYTTYVPFTENELTVLKQMQGILLDVDWFMIFDNLIEMKQVENGKGLYWNYFFHKWSSFNVSAFNNAVALVAPGVALVGEVLPGVVKKDGKQVQLTANVTGVEDKTCTYKLTTGAVTGVTLESDGKLTVQSTCTATEIEVTVTPTATSAYTYKRVIQLVK